MNNFKLTLYELFGYLFPGILGLCGIVLIFFTIFFKNQVIDIDNLSNKLVVVGIFVSYLIGHLIQAICNFFDKLLPKIEEDIFKPQYTSQEILQNFNKAIGTKLEMDVKKLNTDEIICLCDQILIQKNFLSQREIFEYREGFYRGTYVSFAILGLALIIRSIFASKFNIFNSIVEFSLCFKIISITQISQFKTGIKALIYAGWPAIQ